MREPSASDAWLTPTRAARPTTPATPTAAAIDRIADWPSPTRTSIHPARSGPAPAARHNKASRRKPWPGEGPSTTPSSRSVDKSDTAPRSHGIARARRRSRAIGSATRANSNVAAAWRISGVDTRRRSTSARSTAWRIATRPRGRLAIAISQVSRTRRRPRWASRRILVSRSGGIRTGSIEGSVGSGGGGGPLPVGVPRPSIGSGRPLGAGEGSRSGGRFTQPA